MFCFECSGGSVLSRTRLWIKCLLGTGSTAVLAKNGDRKGKQKMQSRIALLSPDGIGESVGSAGECSESPRADSRWCGTSNGHWSSDYM